jgi:hypothetical protein
MSILSLEIQYCTWPSRALGQMWWQGQMEVILRSAARCGVRLLGFGCGQSTIRIVGDGNRSSFRNQQRGLKVGVRHLAKRCGVDGLRWTDTVVRHHPDKELPQWVDWAHAVVDITVDEAMRNRPCTSYWDYHGLRCHHLFDPVANLVVRSGAVSPTTDVVFPQPTLHYILSVSSFVLGFRDADPKSFALFVALAKQYGYTHRELAKALCLTERRIRQLTQVNSPNVRTAYRFLRAAHYADPNPTCQRAA